MEDRVYAAVGGALRAIKHASVAAAPGVDPALRRSTPIGKQLQRLRQDMENHLHLLDRKKFPGAELHNLEVFAFGVEYKIEQFVRAVSSNPLLVIVKDCGCFSLAGLTRVRAGFEFPRRHLPDLLNNSRQITDNVVTARALQGFPVPVPTYPEKSAEIWRSRKDFLYADGSHVVSGIFKQQVIKLVDDVLALLNKDSKRVSLIPIVGMAGIGKTTLAKMVYKSVERHFDCSAMLSISQIPDEYQLTRDLAEQVGLFHEDKRSQLWYYLRKKRYLILLDDVWDTPSWRNLASAIPRHCKRGSIIISTSRNKQVYTSEGGELIRTLSCHLAPLYELQPLDETDSWNLFLSNLFLSNMGAVDPKLIQSLREKIVRKCCGVPLAIVSVADSLCRTLPSSWQDELDKVVEGDGGICSEALELSYQYLPVGLRVCFLYLGLFQEDYELFATDIINQWIAQGFVVRGLPEEDIGESFLNRLVANSMVEVSSRRFDGRIRSFHVLGIVHSFCEWKGGHALRNTAAAHPPSLPLMVERETFLDGTRPFPADLHTVVVCSNYHKFYSKPAVEMLLKGCDFLQVLTPGSRELPFCLTKELGNLKLLAYLGCSDHSLLPAKVKLPSAIGHLNGLLTLDLRNVEYETIPERIWTMEQLRHILLGKLSLQALSRIDTKKDGTKEKKKIKVNLPNLMTLYVVPGQLLPDEVLLKSKKLRKLGIDHPTDKTLRLLAYTLPVCPELEILRLRFHPSKGPKQWFDLSFKNMIHRLNLIATEVPPQMDFPFNTVKLVLEISHVKEDPMEALQRLSRLEILKLYVDRCSLDNMVCSGGPEAFPNLQKLELHLPFHVRKLKVEEHAMPKIMKVTGISSRMLLDVPERIREVCVFTK